MGNVLMCVPVCPPSEQGGQQDLSPEHSLLSAPPPSEISPDFLLSVKAPPSVTACVYVK